MESLIETMRQNAANRKLSEEAQKKKKYFKALWLTSSALHFEKMREALLYFDYDNMLASERVQMTQLDGEVKAKDVLGKTMTPEETLRPIHTIVLMTYGTLIQKAGKSNLGRSRMTQVKNWLGKPEDFDGMVSLSEW